jgi:hypothetical protein
MGTGTQPETVETVTRERVEAYEKALGCERSGGFTALPEDYCDKHDRDDWTDLGCPVAVDAARVEAAEVARLRSQLLLTDGEVRSRGQYLTQREAALDRVRAVMANDWAWSDLAETRIVEVPDLQRALDGPTPA